MGVSVPSRDSPTAYTATFDNVSTVNGQDFLLSVTPPAVISGSSIQYAVNVDALSGFSSSVALSVTGLPAGAAFNFNPSSLTSGVSVLTVTPSATTPANSYPLTITGTSGTLTHTTAVNLLVTANPVRLWTDSAQGNVWAAD